MKKLARIASITLLVLYVISLTYVNMERFGLWGLLAIPLFVLATLYQIITHLIVGDFQEVFIIILWLGMSGYLYHYSQNE